jgi:hypothetical protein
MLTPLKNRQELQLFLALSFEDVSCPKSGSAPDASWCKSDGLPNPGPNQIAEFLARADALYVCKSRTMMTSWAAAGFATWAAQWKGEETVTQTLNVDRAVHLIDYARQLIDNQEPWLSELHPVEKRSAFTISWKGGGEVSAIPSGADAIRAFHPTTYLQDETAFMPEGEEALNAVRPTGAKINSKHLCSPSRLV